MNKYLSDLKERKSEVAEAIESNKKAMEKAKDSGEVSDVGVLYLEKQILKNELNGLDCVKDDSILNESLINKLSNVATSIPITYTRCVFSSVVKLKPGMNLVFGNVVNVYISLEQSLDNNINNNININNSISSQLSSSINSADSMDRQVYINIYEKQFSANLIKDKYAFQMFGRSQRNLHLLNRRQLRQVHFHPLLIIQSVHPLITHG